MRTTKASKANGAAPGTDARPTTHDEYLARVEPDKRAALRKVRAAIQAAAPEAVECISYQIPAYRLDGKLLVFYGAAAHHCALYAIPQHVLDALEGELDGCEISGRGTLRFPAEKPLSRALVRKIVKALIAGRGAEG